MFSKIVGPRDANGNKREMLFKSLPGGMEEIRVSAAEYRRIATLCAVPLNDEDAAIVEAAEDEQADQGFGEEE